jgi:hypothetical protein
LTPVRLASWGKRQSKFNNRRVKTAAGVSFDSESEHRRWQELELLQKAGEIRELRLHPRYDLSVNGYHICRYVADYEYECRNDPLSPQKWVWVCEDRKAGAITQTPTFRIKRKLMLAIFNINVLITGKEN